MSMLRTQALLLASALLVQGCKPDTEPDPFSFASQSRVLADTLIESEAVTVTGINLPSPVSITGGEYSIDGRAYRSTPGTVRLDQKVRLRVRSPTLSLIRRVSLAGEVATFIGTETRQVLDGLISGADFHRPNSCAFSADGTIMYVMEREHGLLRRVDAGAP
jgi:hypothetical protein